ncbi:hypothetical protein HK101_008173 [Irineochytrium annulatum]|nr:hypothetical protein HK101_008173 [Irineochytrium annulatum]
MRQSMLRMEDALAERIITLPTAATENEYILAEKENLSPAAAYERYLARNMEGGTKISASAAAGASVWAGSIGSLHEPVTGATGGPQFIISEERAEIIRRALSNRAHHVLGRQFSDGGVDGRRSIAGDGKERKSVDERRAEEGRRSAIESLRRELVSTASRGSETSSFVREFRHRSMSEDPAIPDAVPEDGPDGSRRSAANRAEVGNEEAEASNRGVIEKRIDTTSSSPIPYSLTESRKGSRGLNGDGLNGDGSQANSFKQSMKADAIEQFESLAAARSRKMSIDSSAESIDVADEMSAEKLIRESTTASIPHSHSSGNVARSMKQRSFHKSSLPGRAADSAVPETRPSRSNVITPQDKKAQSPATVRAKEQDLKLMFQKGPLPSLADLQVTKRFSSDSKGPKSALAVLMREQNTTDNPFAHEYSFFSAKGEPDPLRLKIHIPFSDNSEKPILVVVKKEATVEEVIGYTLYEYTNEGRSPPIPEELWEILLWNMRIVEDDGTIDEDFPALERTRKIQLFSFDQFAICQATPEQIKANEATRHMNQGSSRPTPTQKPATNSASSGLSVAVKPPRVIFLKVHLYSTLEVKQTTTIDAQSTQLMSEIFEAICRKRKYDPKNYVLKMADTRTDVPLDKTLEALKATEFCVLKRDRGGAGDIFLRPPDEINQMDSLDQPRFLADEYSSMYKQYYVLHKQLMGRHERVLTIDGDHIHIMVAENKKVFDIMKTASYHCSSIVSCRQTKKQSPQFKLIVKKGNSSVVTYDLEANSSQDACE